MECDEIIIQKDFTVREVKVKNVPFIFDKHNKHEPYLLDGNTLERVYNLVDEAHSNDIRVIEYREV